MADEYWRLISTDRTAFGQRDVWTATYERSTPLGVIVRTLTFAFSHNGEYHVAEAMVLVPAETARGPYR